MIELDLEKSWLSSAVTEGDGRMVSAAKKRKLDSGGTKNAVWTTVHEYAEVRDSLFNDIKKPFKIDDDPI